MGDNVISNTMPKSLLPLSLLVCGCWAQGFYPPVSYYPYSSSASASIVQSYHPVHLPAYSPPHFSPSFSSHVPYYTPAVSYPSYVPPPTVTPIQPEPPHSVAAAPPGPEAFAPPPPPSFDPSVPPVPIPEGVPLRFSHFNSHSTYGLPY